MEARILEVLHDRFGFERLYPLQQKIVAQLLAGKHALAVMPTGSGKSLCYQLPALALPGEGVALVFSPLIALMEDQVAALRRRGIHAQFINSTLDKRARARRYERLGEGGYELIYATPERMHKPEFRDALARTPGGVKLLAVDEAHCITKWGHDFRPAYREVGHFRRQIGAPPTVALTATATPAVRTDVRRTLGLLEAEMPLYATGVDRPNLSFETIEVWSDDAKVAAIADVAASTPGTGIVYFALIKSLEEAAAALRRSGLPGEIACYHGQLDAREKKRVYDRFAAARPAKRLLLLATNAFGMGVDKADIRFIVHAQIPGSVEAYYQEVGRAGRDGLPARCVLLYESSDLAIQQQFIEWMNPPPELLIETARAFTAHPHADLSADDLRGLVLGRRGGDRRIEYCLTALEKLGVIEPAPLTEHYRFSRALEEEEISADEIEEKKKRDLQRLHDMLRLHRSGDVRSFVLDYFELE